MARRGSAARDGWVQHAQPRSARRGPRYTDRTVPSRVARPKFQSPSPERWPLARESSDSQLERLAALRDAPDAPELRSFLEGTLARASGPVVASAANLIREREIDGLDGSLEASFARLLENPLRRDPQCAGKRAIARAGVDLGLPLSSVYEAGVRHVQLEPVFGGRVDTAAELRSLCAHGLVILGRESLWIALADLLADPESESRAGAARAIAYAGNVYIGLPLLRLRVQSGDADGRVIADCLDAMISIDPAGSLEFVARYLDADDPTICEGAALALGASRQPQARPLLISWLERTLDAERKRAGLLALALLRDDAALEYLIACVEQAPVGQACQALSALGLLATHPGVRARVERAAAGRSEVQIRQVLAESFA